MRRAVALLLPGLLAGLAPGPAARVEFAIDRERTSFALTTHRAGLFGFLGHEHGVRAADYAARLCADPLGLAGGVIEVEIPVAALEIDTPEARAAAGLDPEGGPGADDRAELEAKLRGPRFLDAERFPLIGFVSDSARGDPGGAELTVGGRLTIHGETRDVSLPVAVERLGGDTLRLRGTLEIRHRDFGLRPESTAGVVKVAQEMDLHVDVVAVPTDRPC
jgi:polyisoprenoid-binding protein YceI